MLGEHVLHIHARDCRRARIGRTLAALRKEARHAYTSAAHDHRLGGQVAVAIALPDAMWPRHAYLSPSVPAARRGCGDGPQR